MADSDIPEEFALFRHPWVEVLAITFALIAFWTILFPHLFTQKAAGDEADITPAFDRGSLVMLMPENKIARVVQVKCGGKRGAAPECKYKVRVELKIIGSVGEYELKKIDTEPPSNHLTAIDNTAFDCSLSDSAEKLSQKASLAEPKVVD